MDAYCSKLKIKMDEYAHVVYRVTKNFPREELFGIVSQLRRAALSVILNYIEGYARRKGDNCKVYRNFLGISFGSLKESKYLLHFSMIEGYLKKEEYNLLINLGDEIGAMLYKLIR
jgi:four helix bundle protein